MHTSSLPYAFLLPPLCILAPSLSILPPLPLCILPPSYTISSPLSSAGVQLEPSPRGEDPRHKRMSSLDMFKYKIQGVIRANLEGVNPEQLPDSLNNIKDQINREFSKSKSKDIDVDAVNKHFQREMLKAMQEKNMHFGKKYLEGDLNLFQIGVQKDYIEPKLDQIINTQNSGSEGEVSVAALRKRFSRIFDVRPQSQRRLLQRIEQLLRDFNDALLRANYYVPRFDFARVADQIEQQLGKREGEFSDEEVLARIREFFRVSAIVDAHQIDPEDEAIAQEESARISQLLVGARDPISGLKQQIHELIVESLRELLALQNSRTGQRQLILARLQREVEREVLQDLESSRELPGREQIRRAVREHLQRRGFVLQAQPPGEQQNTQQSQHATQPQTTEDSEPQHSGFEQYFRRF